MTARRVANPTWSHTGLPTTCGVKATDGAADIARLWTVVGPQ